MNQTYTIRANGDVDLGYRVIPVPATISPQAQELLRANAKRPAPDGSPMWARRNEIEPAFRLIDDAARERFPVTVDRVEIAGVPCQIVQPPGGATNGHVLINLHGGGFVIGSGVLVEAVPVAALTGSTVIAVDYRLAPEHRYPAAVDDAEQVYRAVLQRHAPADIAVYGQSAGGFLTGQLVRRLQRERLPLPACIGIFAAGGNLQDLGDSAEIFDISGFCGEHIERLDHPNSCNALYLDGADASDPEISPELGDLSGFPPTLLIAGTRDATLSAAASMHRALRRANVAAELYVFEAMPHGFLYDPNLPEAQEAFSIMARFFTTHLPVVR
jgi:prepilin-type processing-associated H-X9-DG protein